MRTQTDDRVVRRYLDDLERALVGVPAARRRELVADVRAHIAAAREEEPDVPVEQVLDRLGSPADLAEDAKERFGTTGTRSAFLDYLAVGMLLIGGVVLPVVGWFIGLALLLSSPSWTRADKALGAMVVPGGLLPAFAAFVIPVTTGAGCSDVTVTNVREGTTRTIEAACAGDPSSLARVWPWLLLAFLVVGPIATSVRLLRRLR